MGRVLHLVFCACALLGCESGPDYTAPATATGEDWNQPLGGGLVTGRNTAALARWWETLGDPTLDQLVQRAVQGNLDVTAAVARLNQARALRGLAGAAGLPVVGVGGSVTRTGTRAPGTSSTNYEVGLDASWEIDLFGGAARGREAADADMAAAEEAVLDATVSLLAEVALSYADLRAFQQRLRVAERNLATQRETEVLISSQVDAGLRAMRDLNQARTDVQTTESTLPAFRTAIAQTENRIAVLLGERPGALHELLDPPQAIPIGPAQVAVGVPAEALRRRPDVRLAERVLAAETARIGVAEAELYPKLSLSGAIGVSALSAASLFVPAAESFGIGPALSWNVFDAGATRARIASQYAVRDEALAGYQAAVLAALEEVENAIVAYIQEQLRYRSLEAALTNAQESLGLAQDQYRAGIADVLVVLDSQRSVLSVEDQLVESRGTITANLIRLYKALGGGWDVERSKEPGPR